MKPQPSYVSAIQQMRAYRTLRAHVHEILDQYEINSSQWALLGHLFEHAEGATVSELATLLDVKVPLISALTAPLLERQLFLALEPKTDKRVKRLTISPSGTLFVQEIESALVAHGKPLFANVSAEDMRSYHTVLQAIISSKNS